MTLVPALEIGGSHVTAAWVDDQTWTVRPKAQRRFELNPHASAGDIIAVLSAAAAALGPLVGTRLCIAVPGPFDYPAGIARFHGVGKFDVLNGTDLGAALRGGLSDPPVQIRFVNDAAAFTAGEWINGAGRSAHRVVGITLGTGVGSSFLADGVVVDFGRTVPPEGRADLLTVDGLPLERRVSTRAIVDAAGGSAGVLEIVERARTGDRSAQQVLDSAFVTLGRALAPWLLRFGADVMVVGGSISQAWDIVQPGLKAGLVEHGCPVPVRHAAHPDTAALAGAAWLLSNPPAAAQSVGAAGPRDRSGTAHR